MKYIRTKDGRILSLNEFNYEKKYHWYRPNEKYLSRLDIGFIGWCWCFDDEYDLIPEVFGKIVVERIKREECKFADTIEELCDEFVAKGVPNKTFVIDVRDYKPQGLALKDYIGFLFAQYSNVEIYGAIWTDKGLIYVAKMNDKGKLELL